jgi:hypothetical protein
LRTIVYAGFYAFFRTKRLQQKGLRIELMNEIVKSIHRVKMYVWERPFQLKVERVRRYEKFSLKKR